MALLWKRRSKGRAFLQQHVADEDGECLIWPFARDRHGYGIVHGAAASRVMCELVHGEPPTPAHEAAHSCGRGHLGCVHPKHLLWKTVQENALDRIEHGTDNRGERNGHAKLSMPDVLEIRRRAAEPRTALATEFGVSRQLISNIINRHKWKWLNAEGDTRA